MRVSIPVADLFPFLLSKLHNLLRETSISAMADMPIYRRMYKFSFLIHFLMIFIITMQTISFFSFILHLKGNEFVVNKVISNNYFKRETIEKNHDAKYKSNVVCIFMFVLFLL